MTNESARAPDSTRWSRRLTMPEPLQDGSRSLISSDERFQTRRHARIRVKANVHVRNASILLVIEICR